MRLKDKNKLRSKQPTMKNKKIKDQNMLGHEAVRMVLNAVFSYLEDGDPMWLLRSLRTFFKTTKNKKYNKNTKNE